MGSAIDFKKRFRIHKSDINLGKTRCGVATHFVNHCNQDGKLTNLKTHVIEMISTSSQKLEQKLWLREKYWQAQLFTMSHGLNSKTDWYSPNGKGYRK